MAARAKIFNGSVAKMGQEGSAACLGWRMLMAFGDLKEIPVKV